MKIRVKKPQTQLPPIVKTTAVSKPVTFEDIPDEYDPYKHGVTYSLLSTFATCPEKFRLNYVERHTPVKTSTAIDFGNIVHNALEDVYSSIKGNIKIGEDARRAGHYAIKDAAKNVLTRHLSSAYTKDKERLENHPTGNPKEFDELEQIYGLAQVTLEAYLDNWIDEHAKIKWIDLEREITMVYDLGNGRSVPIHAKLDGVYRPSAKSLYIKERKTKGRIDEDTLMDKIPYDTQTQMYIMAAEHAYGETPAGVMYDVIRRSQLRQKQAERRKDFLDRIRDDIEERPEWYFIQNSISFFPDEIRRWRIEFDNRLRSFLSAWDERRFYRESASCDLPGRLCPFLCICAGKPIKGLFVREKTFSELETV